MNNCTSITSCLACGSDDLTLQVDLGVQALANNFIKDPSESEMEFPLAVNRCKHCNHLQLTHVVDPALIYTHYLYVSGTSKTGRDHFEWFAKWSVEYMDYCSHYPGSVLDIGCNDGTQLDYYKEMGLTTYGIDPAENLYPLSSKNHKIYCDFFSDKLVAEKLCSDRVLVDIVVAQNSFAHNPNPVSYLRSLKEIMRPSGLFFVQTSQADMVLNNEFDTIYHEHVNFYNINSMNELCNRAGMHLVDVIKTPIHGTSYIFVISPSEGRPEHIKNLIAGEASNGLMSAARYDQWTQSIADMKQELLYEMEDLDLHYDCKFIGYGAAAKGNTLLNYTGIHLDAIIDDNPLKQGMYAPGSNIPVVSIDYLDTCDDQPIVFVPLAWNFYSEIKSRILAKRNNPNDMFLKYFPEVETEYNGL
jgi:hypothetical protein